jgi:hypothetical protein
MMQAPAMRAGLTLSFSTDHEIAIANKMEVSQGGNYGDGSGRHYPRCQTVRRDGAEAALS